MTGEIGPGAQYQLFLPAEWNGDLVVYIQGFNMNPEPALPAYAAPVRDALLAQHFAFAWTSNSETRMAIDRAVLHTRQLQALFTARVAPPEHTYLLGFSLGSTALNRLLQSNDGGKFDGGVAVCGPLGGLPAQVGYYMNMLVLFNHYFPGVIASTPANPAGFDMAAATFALSASPTMAVELAGIDQLETAYSNPLEMMQSILFPLNFATASWFTGDILSRTGGKPFFDNSSTGYTGSSDDDALNAGVARYTAHPSAAKELAHWYSLDGQLRKPLLALFMSRDPVVPHWHATMLSEAAADAGASDLLLVRTFDGFGHCPVTPSQQVTAVNDLASWVETGVRPGN